MAERFQNMLRNFKFGYNASDESQYAAALDRLDIFSRLSQPQRRRLASFLIERHYTAGQHLIQQDDIGLGMFILISGRVEVFRTEGDTTIQLAQRGPGEIVGEMALIDDHPRSASVQVLEDTDCLLLTRDNFQRLTRQIPEFMWYMVPLIVGRIRSTSERMVEGLAAVETSEPQVLSPDPLERLPEPSQSPYGLEADTSPPSPPATAGIETAQHDDTVTSTAQEHQDSGFVDTCLQLSTASFMLGSSLFMLGVQEARRMTMGVGPISGRLHQQEVIASELSSATESHLSDESQHVLNSFRDTLNAMMALFRA